MLLNVQSEYSLLSSTLRINDYIKEAKRLGYDAIGLADNQVLHGALQFYTRANKMGLKPLIGLNLTLIGGIRQGERYPFMLYAKSEAGYHQLIKISRMVENNHIDDLDVWTYLEQQATDLVYISSGRLSEMEQAIIHEDDNHGREIVTYLNQVFGKNHVFMGMTIYPYNKSEVEMLSHFAQANHIQQVAAQLVNSLNVDEAFSLQILEAIKDNETIDHSLRYSKGSNFLFPKETLRSMYVDNGLQEVWDNTEKLVATLNVSIDSSQSYLPKYQAPDNLTSAEYVKALTFKQLDTIGKGQDEIYIQQLNHELQVIDRMGFSDYFLIVWDIIKYCHEKNIRIGPGRGSAAGSLVSYLLQITLVDPIEFDLLFERFLNPERYNMPDIDIDIPDNKRESVLKYIQKRYGHEQVAQIVTMGTFGAKASVRDTLRVIGADSDQLKRWSQAIPSDQNQLMTLERAVKESNSLQAIVSESEFNRDIFKAAQTIEGLPRHNSTHAAAVVINDFPLDSIIPVKDRENDLLITQFTMNDVEQMGLLKMDFLGLRNLTILDNIIRNIKTNKNIDILAQDIPMNDFETIKLFQEADTNGVFQFESDGIKDVLKRLKPENFEDIVAVNALYRPGPMKQIDSFIRRKHGKEKIEYVNDVLEPILNTTYGIIVYQEQVMRIVVDMAGFSLGEADILRRAMGKKQVDVMEKEREHFVNGAINKGHTEHAAKEVYNYIYEFSNYGFNRAHAVVYSTLAYQLAYLKANYTEEFYQAILNNGRSQSTSYNHYIQEAKHRLQKLLPLDINKSGAGFNVDEGLRIGFNSVNGVRGELIDHILEDRSQMGTYKSLLNFLQRLPLKLLKAEMISPLIYAGAFDGFGANRATLVHNLSAMIQSVEFSGQNINLFQEMEPKIDWKEDYSLIERLNYEKEALGFMISGHPLDAYKDIIENDPDFINISQALKSPLKKKIKLIAMVQNVKVIRTKKNDLMAFSTIGDEFYSVDVVVFPTIYQKSVQLLKENNILIVEGTVGVDRRENLQIVVDALKPVSEYKNNQKTPQQTNTIRRCFIQIEDFAQDQAKIENVKQLALDNFGPADIILVDRNRRTIQLVSPYTISYSYRVQQQLKEIFGQERVVFK